MIGLNNYIQSYVLTQKGIVNIDAIYPGDRVYEYGTNRMINVIDIKKSNCTEIFKIEYSDKRVEYRAYDELMHTGEIKLFPLEYNPGKLKNKLNPDPYIAGVLLTYGDYTKRQISLPADMDEANNLFAHKYHVDYADKIDRNSVYFSYNHKHDEIITWDDFFPNYDFYAKTGKVLSPMIPYEYIYSSIKDRMQFIMGVFDVGYDKKRFPDNVAIEHWNEDRLKMIQKILWSLGIPSKVEYDPIYRDESSYVHEYPYNRKYRLSIIGNKNGYPGFFYNIDEIEHMLEVDDWRKKLNPQFEMKVVKSSRYCQGYISNLLLEEPHVQYCTGNYLPRFSL